MLGADIDGYIDVVVVSLPLSVAGGIGVSHNDAVKAAHQIVIPAGDAFDPLGKFIDRGDLCFEGYGRAADKRSINLQDVTRVACGEVIRCSPPCTACKKLLRAIDHLRRLGGEGMDAGQGVESTQRGPWVDEYDPDCPTELLVDVEGPQENINNTTP